MVERCGGVVEGGGVGGGGALSMPTVVRRRILSVFCCRKAAAKASSPCKQGEPRGALSWRGGRLHQVPLSSRAVSLPQSFCALWAQKSSFLRGSRGGYRRKGTELAQCMPQQLRPPEAGGPHPSRCSAKAQHRATFPKGKAKRCGGAPKAPSTNKHKKCLSQSRQALYFAASQPYSLFSF